MEMHGANGATSCYEDFPHISSSLAYDCVPWLPTSNSGSLAGRIDGGEELKGPRPRIVSKGHLIVLERVAGGKMWIYSFVNKSGTIINLGVSDVYPKLGIDHPFCLSDAWPCLKRARPLKPYKAE